MLVWIVKHATADVTFKRNDVRWKEMLYDGQTVYRTAQPYGATKMKYRGEYYCANYSAAG